MSKFPNKLRSFNWRKFFLRLTLVLSIGFPIVAALSGELTIRDVLVAFFGVWVWSGIIYLIFRASKWVVRGLKD